MSHGAWRRWRQISAARVGRLSVVREHSGPGGRDGYAPARNRVCGAPDDASTPRHIKGLNLGCQSSHHTRFGHCPTLRARRLPLRMSSVCHHIHDGASVAEVACGRGECRGTPSRCNVYREFIRLRVDVPRLLYRRSLWAMAAADAGRKRSPRRLASQMPPRLPPVSLGRKCGTWRFAHLFAVRSSSVS